MIIGNLAGGISYFSSDSILNDSTISYSNTINEILFTIFPNPNQDKISIKSIFNGEIKIYNLKGQIVKRKQKISETETINVSNLNKGIYLIELKGKSKTLIID